MFEEVLTDFYGCKAESQTQECSKPLYNIQPIGLSGSQLAGMTQKQLQFIVSYFELPNLLFLHKFPNISTNVSNVLLMYYDAKKCFLCKGTSHFT